MRFERIVIWDTVFSLSSTEEKKKLSFFFILGSHPNVLNAVTLPLSDPCVLTLGCLTELNFGTI